MFHVRPMMTTLMIITLYASIEDDTENCYSSYKMGFSTPISNYWLWKEKRLSGSLWAFSPRFLATGEVGLSRILQMRFTLR